MQIAEQVRRVMVGAAGKADRRAVARALLAGDPSVLATLAAGDGAFVGATDAGYDRALAAAFDRWEDERLAEGRNAGGEPVLGGRQPWDARASALVELARRTAATDPDAAADHALAAIELVGPPAGRGREAAAAHETLARAFTQLARARRLGEDFVGAQAALAEAEHHLERGLGDPLAWGVFFEVSAAVAAELGDTGRAINLQHRAVGQYREVGDRHREGCALVSLGGFLADSRDGDAGRAIAPLRRGAELIDPAREPRALFAVHHNLVRALLEAGRLDEAEDWVEQTRRFCDSFGTARDRALCAWLEGKLALAGGRLWEAAERLAIAHEAYGTEGSAVDAAMVGTELAMALLGLGRVESARRVALAAADALWAAGLALDRDVAVLLAGAATQLEAGLPLLLAAAQERRPVR